MQEFQPLCRQLAAVKIDTRRIATRLSEASDETKPDWVFGSHETMGVILLAALVAVVVALPMATITATRRSTNSVANAGSRSNCPSAQRYMIATFSPST